MKLDCANLRGADLHDANLRGADLYGADLHDADLYGADLRGANLYGANLHDANLYGADLRGANLYGANLRDANLHDANLRDANLRGANLRGANLYGANLRDADLYGANLRGADLRGANLYDADLHDANLRGAKNIPLIPLLIPEGEVIVWKKVQGYIIKMKLLEDSKRSRATTYKCRCDKALILEIQNADGTKAEIDELVNDAYAKTTYKVGEVVYADSWDEDRWNECSHGIHFFIDRQLAVEY